MLNTIPWIKIFGKVCILAVQLTLGDDYSLELKWLDNHHYLLSGTEQRQYLKMTLSSSDNKVKLSTFYLIPWQSFSIADSKNDDIFPGAGILSPQLITVTDFAIIYKEQQTVELKDIDKSYEEKFVAILNSLINYPVNQKKEADKIKLPEGIQIFETEVYPHYIKMQIAVPGSRNLTPQEWISLNHKKMLFLSLIPDIGPIRQNWIPLTETQPLSESILSYFGRIEGHLDEVMADPNNRDRVYQQIRLETDKNRNLSDDFKQKVAKRFERWFLVLQNTDAEAIGPNPFKDYQPKQSPDTILDLMPELHEIYVKIPVAKIHSLPELIQLFQKYQKEAESNPGQWVESHPLMGVEPEEYKPSKAELLLSEIGERIRSIKQNFPAGEIRNIMIQNELEAVVVKFNHFIINHVDMMGSGRFFEITQTEVVHLELP